MDRRAGGGGDGGLSPAALVDDLVRTARAAQGPWAATSPRARARTILRFHDLLLDRFADIVEAIHAEMGKPRRQALEEVVDVASVARYYARAAPRLLRPERRRGALPLLSRVRVERVPIGVVGIISPWNYPLSLAAGDAIPALAAGNAVVLKPDPRTVRTAGWIRDRLREAGVPAGVLQVAAGGPETGEALVARADYVCFTGSTATGRKVAEACGRRLIGCSLELGGKNAMIVRADADLERAAAGAVRGAFANAGQLCIGIERLYVHEAVYEAFLERFLAGVAALRLRAGGEWDADVGPLASDDQLRKVEAHVTEAVGKGARVLAGGRVRPDLGPRVFEPTVLTDVTPAMEVWREETFGPVVWVAPVASDAEAVGRANDSPYGLSASVWSRDAKAARRVAKRLRAGTVNVNEAYSAGWGAVDAPMGGMGQSGLGRRHGPEGLLHLTESRTVARQRLLPLDAAHPVFRSERARRWLVRALRLLRRLP